MTNSGELCNGQRVCARPLATFGICLFNKQRPKTRSPPRFEYGSPQVELGNADRPTLAGIILTGRRKIPLLERFASLPWWSSAAASALLYGGEKLVVGAAAGTQTALPILVHGLADVAGPLSCLLLIAAIYQAYRASLRHRSVVDRHDIKCIRDMAWPDFERLLIEAFRGDGFQIAERGNSIVHGSADLIFYKSGRKSAVVCRRWKITPVDVKSLAELARAMDTDDAHLGIFVSSGEYTVEAHAFARAHAMQLIDGNALAALFARVAVRLATDSSLLEPEPCPSLMAQPLTSPHPVCPRCGGEMVRRRVKHDPVGSNEFWDCIGTDNCGGIRPIGRLAVKASRETPTSVT